MFCFSTNETRKKMKITIGSDHAGVDYKSEVVEFLEKEKHEVLDVGTFSQESVDYPEFAHLVSKEVLAGADFGVLICGSGNGVGMAANKHKGIRAALFWNEEITKLARQHNDANIISVPARFVSLKKTKELITIFINEDFEGGRHQRRVEKILNKMKKTLFLILIATLSLAQTNTPFSNKEEEMISGNGLTKNIQNTPKK